MIRHMKWKLINHKQLFIVGVTFFSAQSYLSQLMRIAHTLTCPEDVAPLDKFPLGKRSHTHHKQLLLLLVIERKSHSQNVECGMNIKYGSVCDDVRIHISMYVLVDEYFRAIKNECVFWCCKEKGVYVFLLRWMLLAINTKTWDKRCIRIYSISNLQEIWIYRTIMVHQSP